MLLLIIVLLLIFGLPGNYYGYRNGYYGPAYFGGGLGLALLIIVILLLLGSGNFGHGIYIR